MGALVLTLIWVYYAGLIVFVGALVTALIDERGSGGAPPMTA
jgi:membrane protein